MNTLPLFNQRTVGCLLAVASLSTLNAQTIQEWTGAVDGDATAAGNWTNAPVVSATDVQTSTATNIYQLFLSSASNKTIDFGGRAFNPYGAVATSALTQTIATTSTVYTNGNVSLYVGGGYTFNNISLIRARDASTVLGFAGDNTINGNITGATGQAGFYGIRQAAGGTLTVNGAINTGARSIILDGAGNYNVSANILASRDLAIDSTGTVTNGGILGSGAAYNLLIRSGATVRNASTGTIQGATSAGTSRAITNGSLFVNGTAAATILWNVNGGTLGGAGTINDATAMNIGTSSAGRLFSGDTTVAGGLDGLTISNSTVTLGESGTLDVRFNLDGSGVSTLALTNNTTFNINGASTLAITGADVGDFTSSFTVDLVTTSGGASISGSFTNVTYNNAALDGNWTLTQNASGITLSVVASQVPEPSSFAALAGLSVLGFVASRRRRR